ncbi:hypothetical protein OG782_01640 [Streptomyces sp. NBC_00876]|nr:hypothetical protein OG782_01640 [Streptomyces sp. NBC_00876]
MCNRRLRLRRDPAALAMERQKNCVLAKGADKDVTAATAYRHAAHPL